MRVTIRVQSQPGKASEHVGRVPDLRLSDLRRLFEAELAINELTGLRIHIGVDEGDAELAKRVLGDATEFKKEDDPEAERQVNGVIEETRATLLTCAAKLEQMGREFSSERFTDRHGDGPVMLGIAADARRVAKLIEFDLAHHEESTAERTAREYAEARTKR